ncbi:hypothetical protein J2W98_003617 [Paenibacillus peoriae]|uniref:HK97 gp10 family phage protein n=1 Tax=Paenibacillus peoriae TaxID=59893 RepID=A0ABU1QIT6_9BACL|nr:hypothetical protein [Paenibacillus peoriae]MDR6779337.1 hypothetical protein [Paenibacillus peoriae]
MDFNNLTDLMKHLNEQISETLEVDVSKTVRETMKEKIEEEVYSVYPHPSTYQRQREHGGLIDDENIEIKMVGKDTVSVESKRMDDGRNVSEIVETGEGYQYSFPYAGVARPFTEATREELENSGLVEAALYRGLRKKGLDVQK